VIARQARDLAGDGLALHLERRDPQTRAFLPHRQVIDQLGLHLPQGNLVLLHLAEQFFVLAEEVRQNLFQIGELS
jgi:hypothetical protein